MNPTGLGLIAAALSASLVAGTAGWIGRGLVVDHIEIPRVITQQVELCTAVTEKAAADAISAEQLRQFRGGELATEQFIRQSRAADDDRQAEHDLLELEIENYAQRVREGGRVCALDADDLDLLGLHAEPDGAPTGGG
jgi:hypothetical protein